METLCREDRITKPQLRHRQTAATHKCLCSQTTREHSHHHYCHCHIHSPHPPALSWPAQDTAMFPCKTWPGREGAVTELTGSWRLVAVLTTLPCCQRKLSWWSREPPHQSVLSPRGPSLRREITTRITHKSLFLTSHSRDSQQIITTTDSARN